MFLSQSGFHDPCEFVCRILRRSGLAKEQRGQDLAVAQHSLCAIEDSSCIHTRGGVLQDWRKRISDDA